MRLATPGTGLWTIRVEGRRVVQGPQPFALCITGGVGGPAGAIALDRFQYSLSDTVEIEVIDTNAPGPLTAQVMSTTEPWAQNVILTGSNGVFRGSVPSLRHWPRMGDGVHRGLLGRPGDGELHRRLPGRAGGDHRARQRAGSDDHQRARVRAERHAGRGLLTTDRGRVLARSLRDLRAR